MERTKYLRPIKSLSINERQTIAGFTKKSLNLAELLLIMGVDYEHLTREQRCQIHALKTTGMSQKKIAKGLKAHTSIICRELKRNRGKKGYRFQQADKLASNRRSTASGRPICMTPENIEIRLESRANIRQIEARRDNRGQS